MQAPLVHRAGLGLGLLAALVAAGAVEAHLERADVVRPADAPESTPWQPVPLWGGEAGAVAISPTQPGWVATTVLNVVRATGRDAVYQSDTYGAEWEWKGAFDWRGSASPGALVFAGDGRLYSGGRGTISSVSQSSDSGTTFGLGAEFQESIVHQLAASPGPGVTILAAVRGDDMAPGGLLRHHPGPGWQQVTPAGLEGHHATAVAIHAADGLRMAAATLSNEGLVSVVESTDAAESWHFIGAGLPAGGQVTALVYVGDTLLAAVAGHGLYARSGDGWVAQGRRPSALERVHRLHVAHDDTLRILAATTTGLSVSHDGGASWTHRVGGTHGLDVRDVATDPMGTDVVLLAVAGLGVMASVDGGDSFETASVGIADAEVGAMAAHPLQPLQLAATVRRNGRWRIIESFDGGESWLPVRAAPIDASLLQFAPDGALWSLAEGPGGSRNVYRRSAAGTWRRGAINAPGLALQSLGFATDAAGVAWAGGEAEVDSVMRAAAWRSNDDGASWTRAWTGPLGQTVASVGLVPGSGGAHVLVSTDRQQAHSPAQLRLSLDGGEAWFEPDFTPQGDWSLIQLCTQDDNNGSARVFIRDPDHPFFGASTHIESLVEIADGGQWLSNNGLIQPLLRSPQCVEQEGIRRVYLREESSEPLAASSLAWRTFASGGFATIGAWDYRMKQPTRANALAVNESGVFLATNRGMYRNPVNVVDDAPGGLQLDATDGRGQRLVTLSWTGGGDWVDVLRDGEVVASVPNTGTFHERLLRRGSMIDYRVCNSFGNICSAPVALAP